jgi:hypothetical protein
MEWGSAMGIGDGSDGLSLEEALAGAQAADRLTRIQWRDRIAAHGPGAIDAVFEWAGDGEFGAFAVRVIEAVGKRGHQDEATEALVAIRSIGATVAVRRDAAEAISRLHPDRGRTDAVRRASPVPSGAGFDWPGFSPPDFGNVTGTTWRRRVDPAALVPLLLRPLQEVDSDFTSYPIYHLPEVHLALRERYEQGAEHEQGWRASKLFIYASGECASIEGYEVDPHVAVGFWVEKGDGAVKFGPVDQALWDWPRFLDVLRDPSRRVSLERAFDRHPLAIGDYVGSSFNGGSAVGFVARMEDGRIVMRTRTPSHEVCGRGWDEMAKWLQALPKGDWHNLHLWREWPADEAVNGRQPFAVRELLPVLLDLADVYLSVVGRARP